MRVAAENSSLRAQHAAYSETSLLSRQGDCVLASCIYLAGFCKPSDRLAWTSTDLTDMEPSLLGRNLLLDLPGPCCVCVFDQLGLRDALRLSYCCKQLQGLSSQATHRRFACARCLHPAFNPAVVFNSEAHKGGASELPLQDGRTYVAELEHLEGAVLSQEVASSDLYLRLALTCVLGRHSTGEADYVVKVQGIHCGGCGVYLGMRIVQLGEHRLGKCNGSGLVLHAAVLGRCWLPRKYFTLVKADGSEDLDGVRSRTYACAAVRSQLVKPGQCGSVLFTDRAVLSKQHCWDAGGGVEKSWYINHFRQGAVVERNERKEYLCQGEMRVADVHCARCSDRIGWKFCADLTRHSNGNQVMRYGIVRSAFKAT